MSPGKLAHASIAFLLEKILWGSKEVVRERDGIMYHIDISLDTDLFHDWITKVVCRAKNKDDLLRAVEAAKELGMEEYKDYFLIYDTCWKKRVLKGLSLVLDLDQWKLRRLRNIKG